MPHVPSLLMASWLPAALSVALLATAWPAVAALPASSAGGIYSCTDANGRRITSDRPIVDCNAREQRILNSDGSLRTVRPPTPTADERAEAEAKERQAAEARAAQADAVRRDRNLMHRYRTEAAHAKAREAALESVRAALRISNARLAELARERKPLMDELEFYQGRPVPAKLKAQIDANDASVGALKSSTLNQQAEIQRINEFYDAELERLKRLWAGAPAGSLGPLPPALVAPKP
jgi:Domain of unknown function (DUF4124)